MRFFRTSFLTLALIASSALLLVGCQSGDPNQGITIDDVPLDRRIGVISSLGSVPTTSQGTHLLKLDNGDTILLKSLSINLDDEKYADTAVEVRGILTYTKGDKPLMEVQNIDILENYVLEDRDAPEWKTYSSTLFSIDYRDDFELEKDSQGVTFTKTIEPEDMEDEDEPLEDVVSVTLAPKEEGLDLLDFLSLDSDDSSELLSRGFTRSQIGRENYPAVRRSEDSTLTFYVEGEVNFYTLQLETSDHEDALKHENIFFDMLNTFELESGAVEGDEMMEEGDEMSSDALESRTLDFETEEMMDSNEGSSEPREVSVEPQGEYESFSSDTFGVTFQYPSNLYFEGTSAPGTIRRYRFGDASFDDEEADPNVLVTIDLLSESAPEGETITVDGKTMTQVMTGGNVEVYYEGSNRTYKVTGPLANEKMTLYMASLIEEE